MSRFEWDVNKSEQLKRERGIGFEDIEEAIEAGRILDDIPHPSPERYHHNRTGEDNADAHHKRQIMGREVVVAITDGKLHLGPWEHIFYYEFDGRRRKRILVKIIGD